MDKCQYRVNFVFAYYYFYMYNEKYLYISFLFKSTKIVNFLFTNKDYLFIYFILYIHFLLFKKITTIFYSVCR